MGMGMRDSSPHFWDVLNKEEKGELLKEACDVLYVQCGLILSYMDAGDCEECLILFDEMIQIRDLFYRLFGERQFNEAFRRVHESNLSKLDDNGNPVKDTYGKVMKGLNYVPAHLRDLV